MERKGGGTGDGPGCEAAKQQAISLAVILAFLLSISHTVDAKLLLSHLLVKDLTNHNLPF